MKKEALLYEQLDGQMVRCFLCSHGCRIAENKFGFCGVRQNSGGKLYTHVYANPCALQVDPIEKKPLYHFLPGTYSYSLATVGCNFHCGFCQNWQISQASTRDILLGAAQKEVPARDIVAAALRCCCRSISYTYTEPTIFFEYALDIARIAKENKLSNVFVTNGYMSAEALSMIEPYLDAANVDLKFFKDASYKKICSATLQPVLDSIKLMKKMGIWVEITTLIVPGENDSEEELAGIAGFIAGIDKDMPWHVSRFHPDYKFSDRQATPEAALKKACVIGKRAGLNYVYAGNVDWGNDTYCPNCKKILIKRVDFSILENNIKSGKCAFCAACLPGRFE
ncbi:MAG: AmmeMemoRadiSam system radical SAM enzyme [Candidatus Omnitrophota bacterium]|nr:AmmeMemoRadiSam system radical SAM enzyme [Candidatus Omnitrophota bacterium]